MLQNVTLLSIQAATASTAIGMYSEEIIRDKLEVCFTTIPGHLGNCCAVSIYSRLPVLSNAKLRLHYS